MIFKQELESDSYCICI